MSTRADIVVIGGGVAGLWTRAVLAQAGYRVVLLESRALGAGQTVASQGILHRGVKYALSAEAREASHQLADAQGAWRDGLAGKGPVDLRTVCVLAERMHLWAVGLLEKATGVGAALAMRSEVRRLERDQYPEAFAGGPGGCAVWEVDELCIEAATLAPALLRAGTGPVVRVEESQTRLAAMAAGESTGMQVRFGAGGTSGQIAARGVVLTAGEGNERLVRELQTSGGQKESGPETISQRRPLHMVLMRGAPCPLFAHQPRAGSDKPRLTVTSAKLEDGWCWYLGGELAETGVERARDEQIAAARATVREGLGWIDVSKARWATFRIDRAEGRTEGGRRPDGPVVRRVGPHAVAVWPTKLALAPVAAGQVLEELKTMGVTPGAEGAGGELERWPVPETAGPPWAWRELEWS